MLTPYVHFTQEMMTTHKIRVWGTFTSVCFEFGIPIYATDGKFLTHEIGCDEDDFIAILELTKELL
jgi:hypothetical protein